MLNIYFKYKLLDFYSKFFAQKKYSFPTKLMGSKYIFKKPLKVKGTNYQIAVYRNSSGGEVIAKMWSGTLPNMALYWLKNEARVYKTLTSGEVVKFPKFYGEYVDKNRYIIILEKVTGRELKSLSLKDQANNYLRVVTFFSKSKIKSMNLIVVGPIYYYLFFPILLILSLLKNKLPNNMLVKPLRLLPESFRVLTTRPRLVFAHRDLDDTNIIISRGKPYVFDFQIAGITFREFELANVYVRNWQKFQKAGLDLKIDLLAKTLKLNIKLYKFMKVFCVLYDLAISHDINEDTNISLLKII